MSLSKVYSTPLLLDAFMKWAGLHPLAFHDLDVSTCIPNVALSYVQCQQFAQFPWQTTGASIELIAEKLQEAYSLAEQILDFSLQPTFIEDKVDIPKFFRSYMTPNGYLTYDTVLQTNKRCIKDFGQRSIQQLSESAIVTYSDEDNDGYDEIATIVFTLVDTVDFSTLDTTMVYITHANKSGNKQFKIPVTLISYDATTVTVSGYAWDFLSEDIVFNTSFTKTRSIDACNSDYYITNAELWYEYADSTKPHGYIVCKDSTDNIPFQVQIINNELGTFKIFPGTVDDLGVFTEGCAFPTGCSNAAHIQVFYISNCGNSQTDTLGLSICPTLLNSVFKLTCCLIPLELCTECSNLRSVVDYYQTDLAYRFSGGGQSSGYSYSYETFIQAWNRSCRGAVEAFRELSEFQNSKCGRIETISNYKI